MQGHMRQRTRGVWELIVLTGRDPLTGKKRYRSRSIRGTKRDAQRALAGFVNEVTTGNIRPTDITLAVALDRWLDLVQGNLSPTTLREYRRLISRRITPALGDVNIAKLTTAQLDTFYVALSREAELSPASIRQIHSILRRGLRQAVRWGWIASNPALNATLPRMKRSEIAPPVPSTTRVLLRAASDHDPMLGTLLHLAASTGMRRGELCALKWEDLDLDRSRVTVSRSLATVAGGTTEKSTKTHASRRLALDQTTVDLLRAHRAASVAVARDAEAELHSEAFVFSRTVDGGQPLHPDNVTGAFRRLCQRLGLKGIRLHDLRHAHATQLLAAGVPVKTVSGRLGHASAITTMNVYAHFLEESDEHAATVIGELLAPPPLDS